MEPTTELASDFTVADYTALRPRLSDAEPNTGAWCTVIDAMRRRIQERFLTPVQELARFDDQDPLPYRPGFAILALDCLLIDTIQSFREGRVSTGDVSPANSFKTFLSAPRFSDFTNKDRSEFFQYVRNAIFHNGETRKDWKIRISTGRMLERDHTAAAGRSIGNSSTAQSKKNSKRCVSGWSQAMPLRGNNSSDGWTQWQDYQWIHSRTSISPTAQT